MIFEDRICLPPLNLIHRRQRLLNLLEQLTRPGKAVVTIEAPGGYGKSVLAADFAQTTNLPVCWCTLQATDREPVVLLQLLAHSLASRFYELDLKKLLGLIDPLDIERAILQLSHSLSPLGPHLIIFDDYHQATGPGTSLTFQRLLEYFPETSRFIVAGQSSPGPISKPGASAPQTPVLSRETLAFTAEEVRALLHKRFGFQLDLAQAEMIRQTTQGSGEQILLKGQLMHAASSTAFMTTLDSLSGQRPEVSPASLNQAIFEKQSTELQTFLLATSLLPEVTPRLANQLLGIDTAATLIDSLRSRNVFISPSGSGYKYHPHFATFLQGQLAQKPDQHYHLASRAARLMIENGRFEEAIRLYLSVQAWPEMADFLEERGRHFLDQGQAERLEEWLDQLPATMIQQRARLLLLRGQSGLDRRLDETPDPVGEWCDLAEARFVEQDDRQGAAEVSMVRSARLQRRGHYQAALRLAVDGLDRLIAAEAGDEHIARALQNRGMAYRHIGHLPAALTDTRQALEMFEEMADTFNVGCCHQEIGQVLAAQGKLQQAQYHIHQALRIWESRGNTFNLALSLNSLGNILITLGRHSEAIHQFKQSFEIARQLGAKQPAALALSGSGEAYLGLNASDKARHVYRRFSELKLGDSLLELRNRLNLGDWHYRQGHLFEAFELAAQVNVLADEADLKLEKGLALALQGKVYGAWAEYGASFRLFADALSNLAGHNTLAEIKVRLWWSYNLLLDLRASDAFEQLRTAINLILTVEELRYGLSQTIAETQHLLIHFLDNRKTPAGMRNSLEMLLQQLPARLTNWERGLQFFTFGHPTIVVNGVRKHFSQRGRARKLPEVLAYLLFASRDGGCRWDELSAAIWPELGPTSASTRFHQSIRRLRDTMLGDPDYIVVENDFYQINPAYTQWGDILVFEKLLERISSLQPEESLELQLEVIDLYQGEFLTGFDLEGWGRFYRSQCETRFFRTVKMASDRLLQTGQPWKALVTAKRGLNQDYYREDLHHNVLTAYSQLGLRSELQSHYQQMLGIFERELGGPPLPETDELYQTLKAQL